MKKNKIYFFAIIACACAVFFAACKNSIKPVEDESFTVGGKILLAEEGAFPSNFLSTQQLNFNSPSRSATVSFKNLPDGYFFYGEAMPFQEQPGDITNVAPIHLSVDTENFTWSVKLNCKGKWCVRLGIFEMDVDNTPNYDKILMQGMCDINLNPINNTSLYNKKFENIPIKMLPSSNWPITGNGSISLDVYDATENLSGTIFSVMCTWADDSLENSSFNFSENKATISYTNVPMGTYELFMSFKDSEDKEIYSCYQMVTVLSGCVTDTWKDDGQLINEDNHFAISDDILRHYSVPAGSSYPIILYDLDVTNNYIKEFEPPTPGIYMYSDLDSVSTVPADEALISKVTMATERFAIDPITQTIYTTTRFNPQELWKFSKNYTGKYRREKIYEFNLNIQSMCAYDNFVYFLNCDSYTPTNNSLIRISEDGEAETLATADTRGKIAEQDINYKYSHIDVCDNYIYLTSMADLGLSGISPKLYVTQIPIVEKDDGTHELGTPVSVYAEDFAENISAGELTITDIQAVKDDDTSLKLYILCNTRNISSFNSEGSYLRGGIITVDVSGTTLSFVNFDGSSPAAGAKASVFGWLGNGINLQTALQSYHSYFYGPTRFVARKPDELVIVDEGNYFVDEDGNVTSDRVFIYDEDDNVTGAKMVNINRLVTVSLKDFAIKDLVDINFGGEIFLNTYPLNKDNTFVASSYRGSSYEF